MSRRPTIPGIKTGDERSSLDETGRKRQRRRIANRKGRTTPGTVCRCRAIAHLVVNFRRYEFRLVRVIEHERGIGVHVADVESGERFTVAREDLEAVAAYGNKDQDDDEQV